jgi:hypothetical protein
MTRVEEYRRYASACLAFAQRAADPNDRARLLQMAQAFNELATKANAEQKPEEK